MKKKNETKKEGEQEVLTPVLTGISTLSVEFGREDLNTLVEKINEIINHLNK